MRHSCLSTEVMNVLQFLKYTYQQDHLNLMEGLITSEEDLLDGEISKEISSIFNW
jgi:hypothetical protein